MDPAWWQISPFFDIALSIVALRHCSVPSSVFHLSQGLLSVPPYSDMTPPDHQSLFVGKALQIWALLVNVGIAIRTGKLDLDMAEKVDAAFDSSTAPELSLFLEISCRLAPPVLRQYGDSDGEVLQSKLIEASLAMFTFENKILTASHRYGGSHFPGGKALIGELPLACVKRKVSEEVYFESTQEFHQCMEALENAPSRTFLFQVQGMFRVLQYSITLFARWNEHYNTIVLL